jgi:ABC-type multidrug transport system ATPase subunit
MSPDDLVVADRLGKRFGGFVIHDVSFRLGAGSMLGLVGANGGGKTTTLRMLAGLLAQDEGEARVLGCDVRCPGKAMRRSVGYMSQRLSLYSDLTVAENLWFRAGLHGLPASSVAKAASRFGLNAELGTRVENLSGGWARRAHFAATLLNEPKLLLLDEPTSGLDAVTRRTIWRWLRDLVGAGHIVIVSTHDLAEAEACPAVLHFIDGRADGPMSPAELIAASGGASLEHAILTLAEGS